MTGTALHTPGYEKSWLFDRIDALAFSSDGRALVAAVGGDLGFSGTKEKAKVGMRGSVHVWDTETDAALKTLSVNAEDSGETGASLSSQMIVAGLENGTVHLCYVSSSTGLLDFNGVLEQPAIMTLSNLLQGLV